jgi:hypothetical protein
MGRSAPLAPMFLPKTSGPMGIHRSLALLAPMVDGGKDAKKADLKLKPYLRWQNGA